MDPRETGCRNLVEGPRPVNIGTAESVLQVHPFSEEGLVFSIIGPLDSKTTGLVWRTALHNLQLANPRCLIVDAAWLTSFFIPVTAKYNILHMDNENVSCQFLTV